MITEVSNETAMRQRTRQYTATEFTSLTALDANCVFRSTEAIARVVAGATAVNYAWASTQRPTKYVEVTKRETTKEKERGGAPRKEEKEKEMRHSQRQQHNRDNQRALRRFWGLHNLWRRSVALIHRIAV